MANTAVVILIVVIILCCCSSLAALIGYAVYANQQTTTTEGMEDVITGVQTEQITQEPVSSILPSPTPANQSEVCPWAPVGPVNIDNTFGSQSISSVGPIAGGAIPEDKERVAYSFYYKMFKPFRAGEYVLPGANAWRYSTIPSPETDMNNYMTTSSKHVPSEIMGQPAGNIKA